ncbi:hypothetical protein HDU87_008536 [Geranomyces variabilis]|uniref:Uncharacterized protein n=1 Tax=Geranomyces variabilis TaxID=109894 RepID=A0AAD5XPJ2_9FUNG|nr:hypothetical protein HDU87_008536 [Geranomyces variabilis]
MFPRLAFGEIGDAAWRTFVLSSGAGKDLWEAAKSYGTHETDGMSPGDKLAYTAKRFAHAPTAVEALAALRAHNDMCVRKIGAQGYAWSKANDRIYLHECDSCGEFFLANAKGQGRDLKIHGHGQSASADDPCSSGRFGSGGNRGKLSPLPSLVRELSATVAIGVSAATNVSILIAKDAVFPADELEFLAMQLLMQSSSLSMPPPPPSSASSRPPKRKRANYSQQYTRLDALQRQHAGPGLLSIETVRQELAKDLLPDQAKTARVG